MELAISKKIYTLPLIEPGRVGPDILQNPEYNLYRVGNIAGQIIRFRKHRQLRDRNIFLEYFFQISDVEFLTCFIRPYLFYKPHKLQHQQSCPRVTFLGQL